MTDQKDERDAVRRMMILNYRLLIDGAYPDGTEIDNEQITMCEIMAWTADEMLTWETPITLQEWIDRCKMRIREKVNPSEK